jgi:hypothetical protein
MVSAIMNLPMITATGFSPSSIIFNLTQNQGECQVITITSSSSLITISDKWAENKDVNWSVSKFNTSASDLGITINYPANLTTARSLDVCVSGSVNGEYHGVILMREQQQGNSIIQMGVWIKLTVNEKQETQQTQNQNQQQGSSGGGGGGITTGTVMLDVANNTNNTNKGSNLNATDNVENEKENQKTGNSITGSTIGFIEGKGRWILYGFLVLIVIGIAALIIKNKTNNTKQVQQVEDNQWENTFQA